MTFYIKADNTADVLDLVLRDADGNPEDISGYTGARLHMVNAYGRIVIDQPMTVVDPTLGQVRYQWQESDISVGMVYRAEVEVTFDTGAIKSYPNNGYYAIEVERKLA